MLRVIRFFFVISVVVCGLAIHLRNDQSVLFDYYLGTTEGPFSLFLVFALVIGALSGIAACMPALLRIRHQNRTLLARIRLTEKEHDNLRISPARN